MTERNRVRPGRLCRICGRRIADSREHLPGRGAFNRGPVIIQSLRLARDTFRSYAHEEWTSPDGFFVDTLCQRCNFTTGSRYGGAYAEFVTKFASSGRIVRADGRPLIDLRGIYPGRIAKQMIAMFLAAQPRSAAPELGALREFVRRRDARWPGRSIHRDGPEGPESITPQLYLYRNVSGMGRVVPLCAVGELSTPGPMKERNIISSEVSWPPVGIVYCLQGGAWLERRGMVNITEWATDEFSTQRDLQFAVSDLSIETDHPLGYGTRREVERWRAAHGVVWGFTNVDDPELPTATSVVWRRVRSR